MLRVMRLPLADFPPELRNGFDGLANFVASLPVDSEAKSLIAQSEIDGDYVNFYAAKQGGVEVVTCINNIPQFTEKHTLAQLNFEQRRALLLNTPVDPSLPEAALLKHILQSPQYLVVVDNTEPVLVPFCTNSPSALVGAATGGSLAWLWWLLGLLLLLGLLGFAYYKFLYPWPFEDKVVVEPTEQVTTVIQETEPEAVTEPEVVTEPKVELPVIEEIELPVVDEAEPELAIEPQPKLQKCTTMIQTGKLPMMFLAIDSSGSMILPFDQSKLRYASAIEASEAILAKVDKNININLISVRDCPFANDIGVFSFAERSEIMRHIINLDPRKLGDSGTPFVSAIGTIASKAALDADSVGIIISDGLDSCYPSNFDLCGFVREVHKAKPRLKLNIIYLGNKLDLEAISCVTEITNGKIYNPSSTSELINSVEKASRQLIQVCE